MVNFGPIANVEARNMKMHKNWAILGLLLIGLSIAVSIAVAQDMDEAPDSDCSGTDCAITAETATVEAFSMMDYHPAPWCDKQSQGCLLTGESVTLTAPAGSGYTYLWTKYFDSRPDGTSTSQAITLTVPTSHISPGDEVGAVLSITKQKGSLKCVDETCIKYIVCNTPCCVDPCDFCKGEAKQWNADQFNSYGPLPTGYTYKWVIDGNVQSNPITVTILNGLSAAVHTASINIYHNGNFVKNVCPQTFEVVAKPTATITPS
jgi:hypothetical protein